MADYNNPVPLGEAGTGAAYLLPNSTALAGFNNYLDQQNEDQQRAQAGKMAHAKQIATNWKQAQLNIKGGTIFQPEINQRTQRVMEMGMDLQRLGVDPQGYSNNPQTQALLSHYQQEKQALMSDAEMRDKISTEVQQAHKAYAEQPAGYYDPSSMNDINDFVSGSGKYGGLSNISANGYQLPILRRSYDLQGAVDKLPTSQIETTSTNPQTGVKQALILPDENAHAQIAQSYIQNTPEAKAYVEKQIGMPIENLPSTSDAGQIKKQLDAHYRSIPAISSLAAQGFKTYGDYGNTNSAGVPDANTGEPPAAPNASTPNYDQFITKQATALSQARNKYDAIADNIKQTLDNKIHRKNDTSYDFAYQREMRERQERGQANMKFSQWMKDQQNEGGETVLGNAGGYVPVVGQTVAKDENGKIIPGAYPKDENGNVIPGPTTLQPSASLFTTKLPSVDVTVQPSSVTSYDNQTGGRTYKNAGPISMKVSGIKMVPVWKGQDDNDALKDKEVSANQLNDVMSGKWPGRTPADIIYKPLVYGIQDKINDKGHKIPTPIAIPYEDFKGGNTKKVNTSGFDKYYQQFQYLSKNPKFMALTPQQKAQFIAQYYQQQQQPAPQ